MNDSIVNYEQFSAADLVARVLHDTQGPACVTCSFQLEDMVVLHILRQHQPDIPVLFLDTGYHFAETYTYRDRMAREWNLNLVNLIPEQSVAEQEAQFGLLHKTDPGKCCQFRKVEPLFRSLVKYDLWFTGLRREQSPSRKDLKIVEQRERPGQKAQIKVNPLAYWNWWLVQDYATKHRIEPLPLYEAGYKSIGCEPCTSIPAAGADARSGRWGGTKLECGIHTEKTS